MSQIPRQLVIFGGQGSGKGTQAARLAEQFGLESIGTGDILRRMASEGTPAGDKIAKIIGAGQLVPDDMIAEIVSLQLESLPADRGFVLEGYPRTVRQADLLREVLDRLGRSPASVVFITLDVPRDVVVKRLLERGRHDDTQELIEERLRLYEEQTTPVLKAVEQWATVVHINGNQPVETVTEEISNQLNNAQAQA